MNGVLIALLDECSDDAERGDSEVFEDFVFGGGIQNGVEKEGDMCFEEFLSGLWVEG